MLCLHKKNDLLPVFLNWQVFSHWLHIILMVNKTDITSQESKQVVKVIWHKTASPPQTDGSIIFARWCQCAHRAGHIGATWWIWLNLFPSAHPSPQPKQQIDRFSHFCTAQGGKCLYFIMGDPFPQNCPFSWGIGTPIHFVIHWGRPSPQSKLHHDRFSYFCTGDRRVSLYFAMGAPFPQNCPFPRGIWTPM